MVCMTILNGNSLNILQQMHSRQFDINKTNAPLLRHLLLINIVNNKLIGSSVIVFFILSAFLDIIAN